MATINVPVDAISYRLEERLIANPSESFYVSSHSNLEAAENALHDYIRTYGDKRLFSLYAEVTLSEPIPEWEQELLDAQNNTQ